MKVNEETIIKSLIILLYILIELVNFGPLELIKYMASYPFDQLFEWPHNQSHPFPASLPFLRLHSKKSNIF